MAHHDREFALSRIPVYCQSPTAGPPEHKALLIGINYASPASDIEQLESYSELKGPVNDAKEMKKALIGAVSARAPLRSCDLTRLSTELFDYKEEDICLMTDEEAHKDTALWPSEANIVRLLILHRLVAALNPIGYRCTHCAISCATHIPEMRSSSSVSTFFHCAFPVPYPTCPYY